VSSRIVAGASESSGAGQADSGVVDAAHGSEPRHGCSRYSLKISVDWAARASCGRTLLGKSRVSPRLERDRFGLNRFNGAITLSLFVSTRESRFGVTPFEAITL
jgi:hypothetical protein